MSDYDYFWGSLYWILKGKRHKARFNALFDFVNTDLRQWSAWEPEQKMRAWRSFGVSLFELDLIPADDYPYGRNALAISAELELQPSSLIPRYLSPVSSKVLTGKKGLQELQGFQEIVRETLDTLVDRRADITWPEIDLTVGRLDWSVTSTGLFYMSPSMVGDDKSILTYDLFQLLDGCKISQIHRCQRQDCGMYFHGRSNRKFCSRSCREVVTHREFRKKHPDAHKIYSRLKMRDTERRKRKEDPVYSAIKGVRMVEELLEMAERYEESFFRFVVSQYGKRFIEGTSRGRELMEKYLDAARKPHYIEKLLDWAKEQKGGNKDGGEG